MGTPSFEILTHVLREQGNELDRLGFETFAKYGYSKEWILDPANRDRICITRYGHGYIFTVDNQMLFSIVMGLEPASDGSPYKMNVTSEVRYITKLPEDINNET